MNTISKETEPTSRFNRLPVYEDGYAESHRVARVLYRIVTKIDVDLIGLACFLRNSFEDADATAAELDGSTPEDAMTLAALAITPNPKDVDVIFHENGIERWHRAILTSAVEERWLRLDPITLAPLINGEEQAFTSHMSTFLDWIRRFCSPSLLTAFENEIDWISPKEPTGEQAEADRKEAGPARPLKPEESPKERRERILKRFEEKKAAGSRAPIKEIAAEERRSESTIKQLLYKARNKRHKQ
ncbi:MAG: hypothetical protein PHW25_13325 [Zoogloea sp.]|uniref:hypothetical protein n=1 Tax=Zoogloea sp. TaxID=49181 RepID=UPI002624B621|nr:hypothetical protein [Zoogloea sp.]MDD3328055.1 hypothetical protein [Zoogloea sp.]